MENIRLSPDATASIELPNTRYYFRTPFTEKRVLLFVQSFKRVEKSGCWEWLQCKDPAGYGKASWKGSTGPAHRLSYRIFKGEVATGNEIHHKCKRRDCVNPEHLESVSPLEHQVIEAAFRHVEICKNGHAVIGDNVYRYAGTNGLNCRACKREWAKRNRVPAAPKTHCRRGHEYTTDSVRWYQGRRYCKACHAENTNKYYHEKQAAIQLDIPPPICYTETSAD